MPKMKYIFYKNKYHCSKNEFKSWTDESTLLPDCEVENNRDIIAKVKLYEDYGKSRAEQILTQLELIRQELKETFPDMSSKYENDGYGFSFEVFAISILHQMTYTQAMDCVVHGANDGKVDAVVPINENLFYAYQIKMSDKCDPSDIRTAVTHIDEFIRTDTISDPNCDDLVAHLTAHSSDIKDKMMQFYSVSANKKSDDNIPSSEIVKLYFENVLLPRTHSNLVLRFPIVSNKEVTLSNGTNAKFCNYAFQTNSSSEAVSIFIFAEAEKIVNDLTKQGVTRDDDRLYQDNVRGKLGINEPMHKTISEEPEMYVLYNNGLSVIGDYKMSQHEFIVNNPSFINGQQTLYNLIAAKDDGMDISKITVPVFIKKADTTQERQNIAFFNNAQRPVKDIDLLSLNGELRAIQKALFDKAYKNNFDNNSYFLKLVSSGNREGDAIVPKLFKKQNIISLSEFVRMYWIIYKKSNLGDWKNNISKMIRAEIIDKSYSFEISKSERVCKLIVQFNDFLSRQSKTKRDEYKNADVAFMFLINSFNGDIVKAQQVIDHIREKYFVPKLEQAPSSKLIDLYKTNTIHDLINEAKDDLGL